MPFTPGLSPSSFPYRVVASAPDGGAVLGQYDTPRKAKAEQRKHAGSVVEHFRSGAWFKEAV